jgi:PleD family two-component response regulator
MDKPLALIIEDTQEIAELYEFMLNLLGFESKMVPTRDRALEQLGIMKPQLVLLDLKLRGDIVDDELICAIQAAQQRYDTIVVVITGYPRLVENVQESADLVLLKPIDIRQIGHIILRLCSERFGYSQSLADPKLSELFSRVAFLDRLATNLNRAVSKPDHVFAVLMIDIRIEDANQNVSVSELQAQIADRIIRRLRIADCCSRFGEQRYGVMLSGIEQGRHAGMVARRLRDAIQEPFVFHGQKITAVARIGLSLGTGEYSSPDEVIQEARQGLEIAITEDDDSGIFDAEGANF